MATLKNNSTALDVETTAADVGYEAQLWPMADAFEEQHARLEGEKSQGGGGGGT